MSLAFNSLKDMPLLDETWYTSNIDGVRIMAGFKEWAVLQRLHDGSGKWRLVKDLEYTSENGRLFTVPRGFHTDLASIPRILWPVFPPHGLYTTAATLHDFLYATHLLPRKEADGIFYKAMLHSNVPKWKAILIYMAVRLFGGGHY